MNYNNNQWFTKSTQGLANNLTPMRGDKITTIIKTHRLSHTKDQLHNKLPKIMITILRVWECKWKSTNKWQILLEAEQLIYCLFHHNEQENILGGSTRALNYSMAHMDMEENWKKNHTQTHIQRKRHTERERESAATKHSKLKRQNATKLNKQSHLKITLTLIERQRTNTPTPTVTDR